METYIKPDKKSWEDLIRRPAFDRVALTDTVSTILNEVQKNKDSALQAYTKKFDGVSLPNFMVSSQEIEEGIAETPRELKDAIAVAYNNITTFHKTQLLTEERIETTPGVQCWRKSVAIEKVGFYIPGGSAPLFSTVLMLGVPAQIAGCKEVVLCTPCDTNQKIHPAILYTAQLVGIIKIYKLGGAQAIAAMAYGTESISKVDKIFGPGNQYVTKAKELIQQAGVAIDMPAGPSEVLVIADQSCNPKFVAADLLSQAEHGPDSQVVLLSDSQIVVAQCLVELEKQLTDLPRKAIAVKALANSKAIVLNTIEECIELSNTYAPEHLIIASKTANQFISLIANAGSVFLGNYSCESAGDYASGTNHTLPTNGFAKTYSGVSVDSFVKKINFQELTKKGIETLGNTIEIMAEAEGLIAHKRAVTIRLNQIING